MLRPLLISTLLLTVPIPAIAQQEPAAEPLGRKATLFDGKSLGKWKPIEKNVFEDHGEIKITDGILHLATGQPATGVVYSGPFPTDNYELRLEAKRTKGGDFFCGLTFPIEKSHATLIIGGWGGNTTGISNLEDYSAVDNETTGFTEFENDKWYEIRLRVTSKKVEAWVGSEQIVDLRRHDEAGKHRKFSLWWEQEPARPLGIATWNTAAAIRRIEFERIGGKQ